MERTFGVLKAGGEGEQGHEYCEIRYVSFKSTAVDLEFYNGAHKLTAQRMACQVQVLITLEFGSIRPSMSTSRSEQVRP